MPIVEDAGLNAKLEALGAVPWNKSLLAHTRCPFLRAAAAEGDLDIQNGENVNGKPVLIAKIDSVKKAGEGLGYVLKFFAGFNHTRGLHEGQHTQLGGLRQSTFNLDQFNDSSNQSDGTHDGGVEIIRSATGAFNPEVVAAIKTVAGDPPVLTPQKMAEVIIKANHGDFSSVSGNSKGGVIDLAKSAGEWGLMFCLLHDDHGNVPIDDLENLCKDGSVPSKGQQNLRNSSTQEWIHYTALITAHIAEQSGAAASAGVVGHMHMLWGQQNNGPGCGCAACTQGKVGFWDNPGPSIRNGIANLGSAVRGLFKF